MVMRRVQFVTAQLGHKAGKDEVLARMLGADDLPDGPWRMMDQRTWRTGVIGPATEWGERARQVGSLTGADELAQAQPAWRIVSMSRRASLGLDRGGEPFRLTAGLGLTRDRRQRCVRLPRTPQPREPG